MALLHWKPIVRSFTNALTTMLRKTEGAVLWDSCGIEWPLSVDPILSDKDQVAPALADFDSPFVYGENS